MPNCTSSNIPNAWTPSAPTPSPTSGGGGGGGYDAGNGASVSNTNGGQGGQGGINTFDDSILTWGVTSGIRSGNDGDGVSRNGYVVIRFYP